MSTKHISFPKKIFFYYKFFKRHHYFPSLNKPRTFNEKLNYRKFFSNNSLFSVCADKIEVKKYIKESQTNINLIETYFTGNHIDIDIVKNLLESHDSFVMKANHNSGHIHFIDKNSTTEKIELACKDLTRELGRDFGKRKNENWYSKITPTILVEENINYGKKDSLIDYKFHIFKQKDGSFRTILCVIFDRGSNPHCSYFDEELNWIPISQGYPCIKTNITPPENYKEMLNIALELAKPFNYVRVDLYNLEGKIYFGEFTFADGSGFEKFSEYEHDLYLGGLWHYID